MTRLVRRRRSGQAVVEFALTLSLFSIFVMTVIQLGLLFVAYYSETRMTRETARWLAVNSRTTTDDLVAAHVQDTMLPGLAGGAPANQTFGTLSTDASVDVGSLHVQYTPCVSNGSVCTEADRAPGATLYVQMQYDVAGSHLLFLPCTLRIGSLVVKIPTALPAYRVYVLVE